MMGEAHLTGYSGPNKKDEPPTDVELLYLAYSKQRDTLLSVFTQMGWSDERTTIGEEISRLEKLLYALYLYR